MQCKHCGKELKILCIAETKDMFDQGKIFRNVIGRCEDCDADYTWMQRFVLTNEAELRPFFHG